MLPGGLCNPAQMGTMTTTDSTYEWRNFGEHVRNFPVQSAPVASAFAQLEEQIGSLRDRMAMVVGSTLAKMQGERAVAGSETGFFTTVAEAEKWLLGGSLTMTINGSGEQR